MGQIYPQESGVDHKISLHTALEQLVKPKDITFTTTVLQKANDKLLEVNTVHEKKKRGKQICQKILGKQIKDIKRQTSMSGLIPCPSRSPSSTCHPEGISTETITGDILRD